MLSIGRLQPILCDTGEAVACVYLNHALVDHVACLFEVINARAKAKASKLRKRRQYLSYKKFQILLI